MRSVVAFSLAKSMFSILHLESISRAASCGMMPRRPCTRARGLDLEIAGRAVLIGEHLAHLRGGEDVAEDHRVEGGGGHCGNSVGTRREEGAGEEGGVGGGLVVHP